MPKVPVKTPTVVVTSVLFEGATPLRYFEEPATVMWYALPDVCLALGRTNPSSTAASLPSHVRRIVKVATTGGPQSVTFVSADGLTMLVMRSKRADVPGTFAARYRAWVLAKTNGSPTAAEPAEPNSDVEPLKSFPEDPVYFRIFFAAQETRDFPDPIALRRLRFLLKNEDEVGEAWFERHRLIACGPDDESARYRRKRWEMDMAGERPNPYTTDRLNVYLASVGRPTLPSPPRPRALPAPDREEVA
jgi:hypothetical protein